LTAAEQNHVLIPTIQPLAVWYHDRACSCAVLINVILLFLFILPAIIHAMCGLPGKQGWVRV
uniref:Proteolipid membrane potential modulator n=1 Tax=Heligmosomoides polygyrus TaxID=6339 RepID=A0A183G1Y7_HELPZ